MSSANAPLPLPRRFLRDLLVGCDAGIGSKLIDVGCGEGDLAAFCQTLGIDVAGFDDDAEAIEAGRIAHPDLNLHVGTLANSVPFAAGEYDAAIVRGMDVYEDSLDGIEAFASTANLLSCLKPLGKLVFLFEDAVTDLKNRANVRQDELAEHFAHFPGRCRQEVYAEGIGRFISPSFMLGRRSREGYSLLTMQVPPKAVSRLEWHGFAREAVMSGMQRAA